MRRFFSKYTFIVTFKVHLLLLSYSFHSKMKEVCATFVCFSKSAIAAAMLSFCRFSRSAYSSARFFIWIQKFSTKDFTSDTQSGCAHAFLRILRSHSRSKPLITYRFFMQNFDLLLILLSLVLQTANRIEIGLSDRNIERKKSHKNKLNTCILFASSSSISLLFSAFS